MKRFVLLFIAVLAPTLATAQTFPSRPVKLVTPYSTGVGPDLYMRALAEVLQREWSQGVIVEAKPGGNGFIAIEQVKKARENLSKYLPDEFPYIKDERIGLEYP